jgi:hypothetical protein
MPTRGVGCGEGGPGPRLWRARSQPMQQPPPRVHNRQLADGSTDRTPPHTCAHQAAASAIASAQGGSNAQAVGQVSLRVGWVG